MGREGGGKASDPGGRPKSLRFQRAALFRKTRGAFDPCGTPKSLLFQHKALFRKGRRRQRFQPLRQTEKLAFPARGAFSRREGGGRASDPGGRPKNLLFQRWTLVVVAVAVAGVVVVVVAVVVVVDDVVVV